MYTGQRPRCRVTASTFNPPSPLLCGHSHNGQLAGAQLLRERDLGAQQVGQALKLRLAEVRHHRQSVCEVAPDLRVTPDFARRDGVNVVVARLQQHLQALQAAAQRLRVAQRFRRRVGRRRQQL
eukprot:363133-Chlamydomonas_euryale.AAC.8